METQRWPLQRKLQSGSALVVAHNAVGEAEGEIIHRAGGRYADIPVAETARKILNGAEGARLQHFNYAGGRGKAVKKAGPYLTAAERLGSDDLPQIVEVGGDAVQLGGVKRLLHLRQRRFARLRMDNQFGDHRIVKRRDF